MSAAPDIRALDADHAVAVWQQTVLCIWRGAPTLGAIARLTEISKAVLKGPGPCTSISVIERTSPAPQGEVRRAVATWSSDVCSRMAVAVVVAEGGGFRSSMIRGVGVTLTTLIPHKVPFRFVGRVEEALDLVAPHLPVSLDAPTELLKVVSAVRRTLDARKTGPASAP